MIEVLTPAQLAAENLIRQSNAILGQWKTTLTNGIPARAATPPANVATPAITVADLTSALGSVNSAQFTLFFAAAACSDATKLANALAVIA